MHAFHEPRGAALRWLIFMPGAMFLVIVLPWGANPPPSAFFRPAVLFAGLSAAIIVYEQWRFRSGRTALLIDEGRRQLVLPKGWGRPRLRRSLDEVVAFSIFWITQTREHQVVETTYLAAAVFPDRPDGGVILQSALTLTVARELAMTMAAEVTRLRPNRPVGLNLEPQPIGALDRLTE